MERIKGYSAIFIMYGVAFFIAWLTYLALPEWSMIAKILIADIAATLTIYLFSVLFNNASIYDPYWSVAPMVIVPFFVERLNVETLLMVGVLFFWGIRLTVNWAITFTGFHHEDWRYRYFKTRFPKLWPLVNLFGIHLMPTIVVYVALIPAILYVSAGGTIGLLTLLGAFMAIGATLIQWSADRTLHAFKREERRKAVCKEGLWKYSRHPNYFGEILMWSGVFVMLLGVAPEYYLSIFGPLLMVTLFTTISIPLMEKRQLENKPEYGHYVETTHALIPVPFRQKNVSNEESDETFQE